MLTRVVLSLAARPQPQLPSVRARWVATLLTRPPFADHPHHLQNFFLDMRLRIASREPQGEYTNIYVDGQDYKDRAGAKLKGMVDISRHGLSHDEIDMPTFNHDGPPIYPKPPARPNPGKRKIVIMHEFTMMAAMIESVSSAGLIAFKTHC